MQNHSIIGDNHSITQSFGASILFPDRAHAALLLSDVAALITGGNTEQLSGHLMRAKDNGLTETELKEVITHLAFYAGWPKSMSAIAVAKRVFGEKE